MILKPSEIRGAFSLDGVDASGGSLKGHRKIKAPRRVVIVGANGSGKTWTAQRLAARIKAPLIHKDALALTTGWVQRSKAEVRVRLRGLTAGDAWVLEGGPSVLSPDVLDRVTFIVWLDVPRSLRVRRILCRSLRYSGRTRPEHPRGNRDWPGRRQMAFAWRAWRNDDYVRAVIAAKLDDVPIPVARLRSSTEVSDLIEAAGQRAERL